jgi:hypothetical protein
MPSTLNTDLIIWQPQWIVVAVKCEIKVEIMGQFRTKKDCYVV